MTQNQLVDYIMACLRDGRPQAVELAREALRRRRARLQM